MEDRFSPIFRPGGLQLEQASQLVASQRNFGHKKSPSFLKGSIKGWKTGFEPATSGTTIRRSNQLSYNHHFNCGCKCNLFLLFPKEKKSFSEGKRSNQIKNRIHRHVTICRKSLSVFSIDQSPKVSCPVSNTV